MNFLISEDEYYQIEHCDTVAVAGYLIVTPKLKVNSLPDLPVQHQDKLGSKLSLAVRIVNQVVKPQKIYCALFAEESNHIHFHVFPRSGELTKRYLAKYPEHSNLIHGPIVLDWARTEYRKSKNEVWDDVSNIVLKLKKCITS